MDVPYTLATEEAERIGVDHVARMSSAGNSEISSGEVTLTEITNELPYVLDYKSDF